jgi:glutathione S-transferase
MWVLRSVPASPFGRKVRIAAAVCGLSERITIEAADTNDPADSLRRQNPLGKVPSLVLADGTVLYDSRVIVEFLDSEAGGNVIIPAGRDRFPALVMQALADGIMEAALLRVYEGRFRPQETHSARWLEHQSGKIDRALANIEDAPPEFAACPHVGQIALACALGYLDFRLGGEWRVDHPRLVAWLDRFATNVPSFATTAPA